MKGGFQKYTEVRAASHFQVTDRETKARELWKGEVSKIDNEGVGVYHSDSIWHWKP